MFPVSQDYKDKIGSDDRTFKLNIRIEHSKGTLNLTQDDIVQGSFKHRDSSQSGNDYTIGGVVASDIEFSIMAIENKYDDIVFSEAIVYPTVALKVIDGQDAHFLQPTQPSKMKGFDDKWEEVPLGKFNIDIVERTRGRILIKAIDNMIFLDSPYSRSKLSYPATLFQIYENICSVNNLLVGTLNFPNKNYVVKKRPSDDLTFREVLSMVAELSGSFATINTIGKLELKWYSPTGVDILPSMRYDSPELIFGDDIQITGIQYEVDEKIYLFGEPKYVIDISENELVSVEDLNTVLPNILDRIGSVVFKPYSSSWIGNPALQVGDIITHKLVDGTEYSSIITHTEYQYFGPCSIKGSGQASITRSYSDSGAKELNRVIREVEDMLEQGKSDLEKAQDNSTELMANMLGGYFIKDEENGILYITDNPKLENSTKIWKWGTGGFGYSEDGGKTWNTSITADGSIVAELISAGIVTADMVKTGLLSSTDGSTWINLDDGSFSFKEQLVWDSTRNKLVMGSNAEIIWDSIKDVPPLSDEALTAWAESGYATNITPNGLYTGTVTANKILIGGENGVISFNDLSNKPWIPQNAKDVGAKPGDWVPTWAEIQAKPTILTADDIKTTIITKDWIGTLGLMVGSEIQMGANAKISWNNVTSKPGILSTADVTTITNDTIKTTNIEATNLKVRSANITGNLVASSVLTKDRNDNRQLEMYGNNLYFFDLRRDTEIGSIGTKRYNDDYGTTAIILNARRNSGWALAHDSYDVIAYKPHMDSIYLRMEESTLFWRDVQTRGDLFVSGRKDGLHDTQNYGGRLISAYETAEYYYGDLGTGLINEEGECLVYIDEIFQECVNTNINYHVFTQAYNGRIESIVKEKSYFIVYGEPNTEFSWELKAKRRGYEEERMPAPSMGKDMKPSNIVETSTLDESDGDLNLKVLMEGLLTYDLTELLLNEEESK